MGFLGGDNSLQQFVCADCQLDPLELHRYCFIPQVHSRLYLTIFKFLSKYYIQIYHLDIKNQVRD